MEKSEVLELSEKSYVSADGGVDGVDSDYGDDDGDDSCPSFLAHIRPGFWD